MPFSNDRSVISVGEVCHSAMITVSPTAMLQPTAPLSEDKENQRVSRRAAAVLARDTVHDDWTAKHGRLRERLVEEQDYLRVREGFCCWFF